MKQILKGFLSVALLTGATVVANNNDNAIVGIPFFAHRPQGDDLVRRMVGEVHYLTRCDTECLSGAFSAVAEYTRTFKSKDIAQALTFNGQETMVFRAPTDNTTAAGDVNPENFLLASNFNGSVTFKPRVENFIFDLNLRLNLDEWLCGLYFEIGLPINWTRWDLRFEETGTSGGTTINANVVNGAVAAPVSTIIDAWKGQAVAGRVLEKMNKAVVDGRQHKTSVADIEFILGYNIWCTDCGHFGINFRVAAPTGTRPDGDFFFEPIVGNGKHTQVGGGITGHYVIWENDCDQSFSIWFEGEVHHLFRAKQYRTFDLIGNGPGSRYLLLKKFNDATASQQSEVVRGPNILTREVDVRIGAAGEAVVLFNYQYCGFSFDFGYNIWGRTKEKISLRGDDIPAGTYAVKGHAPTTALNTQTASTTKINGVNADTFDATPVFITNDSLDLNAAANPGAISHKFFGHLGYAWEDCDYAPFIGIGGFGEWSGRKNRAFNQWGVWVKGGFAFS